MQPKNPDYIMLWAACTTCFFGFLRSVEVTSPKHQFDEGAHLAFGDVTLDLRSLPKLVQVKIKASKADPFRQGISIFLGTTNSELCRVAAMAAYLASRGDAPGPFSQFNNGEPLPRELLVKHLREALTNAGIDALKFSDHSCSIGGSLIETLGWLVEKFSISTLHTHSLREISSHVADSSPSPVNVLLCLFLFHDVYL